MGKWTLGHHDEVLQNKFKNLVTGAVKRIKLEKEKDEAMISYEAFVDELDPGDSFTTTIVEVLVKEIADRRTRTNADDRQLISERTAKALRKGISSLHVYRGRRHANHHSGRTGPNFVYTDLVTQFTDEDEAVDNRSDHSETDPPLEGVRLNNDLYDAYNPTSYPSAPLDLLGNIRASGTSPLATGSPNATEQGHTALTVRSPSPVLPSRYQSTYWPPGYSEANMTGQLSSLRRPTHSRNLDFNEFSSRRRASVRQSQHEDEYVRSEDSTDGTWRFRSSRSPSREEPSTSSGASLPTARRFFPSNPWGLVRRRHEVGGAFPWSPEPSQSPSLENPEHPVPNAPTRQSSSQLWFSLTSSTPPIPIPSTSSSNRRATISDINEARRQVIAPRLRRGGIRAPESLLSRYASPAEPEREDSHTRNIGAHADEAGQGLSPEWLIVGPAEHATQLPTPARSVTPVAVRQEDA